MKVKKIFSNITKAVALAAILGLSIAGLAACGPNLAPGEGAIIIETYDQFKAFIEDYNSKAYLDSEISEEGKYLYLAKDIDCGGDVLAPILSTDHYGLAFKFDGAGHKISNFKINEVKEVGTATGTASAGIKVLGLFPKANGGELVNIEFADFKLEGNLNENEVNSVFDKGTDWEAASSLHVGLVGYSKSSGAASDETNTIEKTNVYKNVKLTNMTVDITINGKANTNSEFPMAIGGLIGLDADTLQRGEFLQPNTTMAMRENITVKNLDVKVNMGGGAIFVGGVVGQSNWERVTYKNCQVDGKVTINNAGDEAADYNNPPMFGSTVNVGGVVGGSVKREYEIVVDGGKTDVDFVVNAKADVNAGNVVGVVVTPKDSDPKKDQKPTHALDFSKFSQGKCTLKLGDGEVTAIDVKYVEK